MAIFSMITYMLRNIPNISFWDLCVGSLHNDYYWKKHCFWTSATNSPCNRASWLRALNGSGTTTGMMTMTMTEMQLGQFGLLGTRTTSTPVKLWTRLFTHDRILSWYCCSLLTLRNIQYCQTFLRNANLLYSEKLEAHSFIVFILLFSPTSDVKASLWLFFWAKRAYRWTYVIRPYICVLHMRYVV